MILMLVLAMYKYGNFLLYYCGCIFVKYESVMYKIPHNKVCNFH